ncbi:MAG TPA: M67 family metallopeptidase [Solirubrobacterales bacterium]|nr:M67 family metallopeptidase [Solirubrobacterales bacterium]
MVVPREFADAIVRHAREDYPNECCGLFAVDGDAVSKLYPAENIHHSPLRFEIDGLFVMKTNDEIESNGLALGLYHSHTKSPAHPSQTDVNFAELWPGAIWLIVSLADPDAPDLKAFRITGPDVEEVELTVD